MVYTTSYETRDGRTSKVPEKKEEKQRSNGSSGGGQEEPPKNTYGKGE